MNLKNSVHDLQSLLDAVVREEHILQKVIDLVILTLQKGRTVYTCGNGGSASDAEHLAAELLGRFKKDRKSLPALSLCGNSSLLTCVGNDYGFKYLFSRDNIQRYLFLKLCRTGEFYFLS